MTQVLGGKVSPSNGQEYMETKINIDRNSKLFKDVSTNTSCWMKHSASINTYAPGFTTIGKSDSISIVAVEETNKSFMEYNFT